MIKEKETVRLILKILKLCTGVPTLCDFIFAYGHGYPQFGCLTEVLLGCITLIPPTIWQLGKNNFTLYSLCRVPLSAKAVTI
jgi:hypothetical protein